MCAGVGSGWRVLPSRTDCGEAALWSLPFVELPAGARGRWETRWCDRELCSGRLAGVRAVEMGQGQANKVRGHRILGGATCLRNLISFLFG